MMPISDSFATQRCLTWNQPQIFPPRPPANAYCRPVIQTRPVSAPYHKGTNAFGEIYPQEVYRVVRRPAETQGQARRTTAQNRVSPHFQTNQPYGGARLGSAASSTSSRSSVPGAAPLPQYYALNDPHLYDFYVRKYMAMDPLLPTQPKNNSRLTNRRAIHSLKIPRDDRDAKASYRVAVTTGDKRNAGTDAKVFIAIKGSKGKLPKRPLTKKTGTKTKRPTALKFNRGTTHIFKFDAKDVGDLVSITIEHDGVTEAEGWYLDHVKVTKVPHRTGKEQSWMFLCQNWLSLHEGDCLTRRQIFTEQSAKTEYEVVVVTGNMKGAGTDANVFLTIYGKTGQSQKLPLRNRENENPFEKNKSDIFILKSNCVGQMTKIRIEHDNTGMAPGWFLDRVVVTDLRNPKWKYYFPCGQWLAKDEGDGQICRDLPGSLDPLAVRKMNQYRLTVYTGDKRNAGTDANVTVTLFGDVGESGERRLDTRRKNDFERGSKDEFVIECPSLGTLQRLRVSHDNSGASAGWFLDKIIVDDMERNRVYEFPCGRWLARDEDDGQTSRDLVCGVSADDAHPGVPYKITAKTGDVSNAGTSAGVYIVLYGGKGGKGGDRNSGKIWLRGGKFERGRTDIFDIEVAEKLSPLSRIDIGHDNKGLAPGWFLDEVTVFCPSAGCEQLFRCGKWLALDEGDKLIERTLHETERRNKEMKNTWFVWVSTGNQRGGGTDANVFMVAYGKNKNGESVKSDVIPLGNKGDGFEVGQVDKFKVEMIDIGRPYKIRIGHDDSKPYAGWMLDKVEMENMGTKKRYTFNCGRWLAKDEDDGAIVRELPAEGEDIKRPEKVLKYSVSVVTGKKMTAGTNANVFLNVFGEQGDTGERPLEKSSTNRDKFEKGNTDEFVIEAVNLKKLKKIRIGHDGKNPGSGWFLDKVIVKPVDDPTLATVFECNRWLDTKEDDGSIVRELTATGTPQMLSTTSYHVSVKTGKNTGAGTDANVFLQVFGQKGDTGRLQLKSAENSRNKFEAGRTDLFRLEAEDIGKIKRIRIGHDGTNPGAGWFLDEVKIDVPSRGECYIFAFHRWLDKKEDDGQIEVEMEPTSVEKGNVRIPYEVTIWTGDVSGGGTDAMVFIQMYGEGGKTEEYSLRNKTDNFEKGQMDKFKIEAADVGPLLKVRVGHDGNGSFAGWFLDKLLIQRHPSKTSKRWTRKRGKQVAPRRKSMDEDSSDGGMSARNSRKKYAMEDEDSDYERTGKRPRSGSIRRPLSRSSNGSRSPRSPRSPRPQIYESDSDYESKSGMRYGKGKGRKSSLKSQGVLDSDDDDLESRSHGGRRKKRQFDEEEDFDGRRKGRGKRDKEREEEEDFDGRRKGRGKREKEREEEVDEDVEDYWFVCNRWFAKNEDDHKIVRELLPTTEDGKLLDGGLQEVEYVVKVFTGDKRGAGTDANVFINITGEMGDTGERHLQDSNNTNKFERNKEDVFKVSAVELGQLKKVKIRHDNKGGGAAWFLDHIEVEDPKTRRSYYFPCNRWLATGEDDGQISRDLLPIDKRKMSTGSDAQKIQEELALEAKALMTTYHVFVYTGDKFAAGTDANVYIVLFGEIDDSGVIFLKSSKNNKNKFERKQMDEFVIEAIDIGELKKIKIGHDNAGGGGAWFLDHVEIDSPSLGKKWYFPHGRWLDKGKDDGKLERELYPQDMATEEYAP